MHVGTKSAQLPTWMKSAVSVVQQLPPSGAVHSPFRMQPSDNGQWSTQQYRSPGSVVVVLDPVVVVVSWQQRRGSQRAPFRRRA